MKIRLYQINMDRDSNGVAFAPYDKLSTWQGSSEVNAELYDEVYEGNVETQDLEGIYKLFNFDYVKDYEGRSLSVSDVVEVIDGKATEPGFYYCDSIGFKKIDFDPGLTEKPRPEKMSVLLVEPGKIAREAVIGTKLEDLQAAVGGSIEPFYPFTEEGPESGCCIVCNDEGKFNGMLPNRAVYGEDGELMDIIFGTFFICDATGENFGGLSDEQMEHFSEKFKNPERFFRVNGEIKAVPYDPVLEKEER